MERSTNGRYRLRATVTQNDPEPLMLIQKHFSKATQLSRQGNTWRTNLNGDAARSFLAVLLPYLLVKRDLVKAILDLSAADNDKLYEVVTTFNARWKKASTRTV